MCYREGRRALERHFGCAPCVRTTLNARQRPHLQVTCGPFPQSSTSRRQSAIRQRAATTIHETQRRCARQLALRLPRGNSPAYTRMNRFQRFQGHRCRSAVRSSAVGRRATFGLLPCHKAVVRPAAALQDLLYRTAATQTHRPSVRHPATPRAALLLPGGRRPRAHILACRVAELTTGRRGSPAARTPVSSRPAGTFHGCED